ncbi:MAG: nuclear transport factor 2 family protein [Chitinophagaceae bacterium]|nr:MAG: nuclear transport factor 2 family protein [Chitinophagaceae bacterium]
MKLPQVVTDLIDAQNSFDSSAWANCFSENGVMIEEGEPFTGRAAIQALIEETNKKYQTNMKAVEYTEESGTSVLAAECSGTFPGSPAVLKFHMQIIDGKIQQLKVTG